jgi:carbonic anhydrase
MAMRGEADAGAVGRRRVLRGGLALAAGWALAGCAAAPAPRRHTLTRAERDALSPEEVLGRLREGNRRFAAGRRLDRDLVYERHATAPGQYPMAAVLSCIDSRSPAELIFDAGLGDLFTARVAGNALNPDLAGSLEFACHVAGARAVVVVGHTSCGAVKGAIDDVQLGNLTGLLARIQPAVRAVTGVPGPRTSANAAFVDAVAARHVVLTVDEIRRTSPLLRQMESERKIALAGAMHALDSGRVELLPAPA